MPTQTDMLKTPDEALTIEDRAGAAARAKFADWHKAELERRPRRILYFGIALGLDCSQLLSLSGCPACGRNAHSFFRTLGRVGAGKISWCTSCSVIAIFLEHLMRAPFDVVRRLSRTHRKRPQGNLFLLVEFRTVSKFLLVTILFKLFTCLP